MKTTAILLALAALAAAFLPACNRSSAKSPLTAAPEPSPAVTYKEGRGLQLSAPAAAFIALQTAEAGGGDPAKGGEGVRIPATALLRTAKGTFVFVANGSWFLRTPVTVGENDGPWLTVKDGLYEGDVVVTRGVQALWLAEIQAVNGGVGCADGH